MSNTPVPIEITLVIILVAAAFVAVCIAGFIVFSRFLGIEKERARRFRKVNTKPTKLDPKL